MQIGNAIGIPFNKNSSLYSVEGLLDFDGVDDHVRLSSMPDLTGSKTISFKLYMPSTSPSKDEGVLWFFPTGGNSDNFCVYYNNANNDLIFQVTTTTTTNYNLDYDSYSGQILNIVVVKTAGALSSITINGQSISLTPGTISTTFSNNTALIGSYSLISTQYWSGLIWDINIDDSHTYDGYPNGNQDSAWGDGIGSIDGTVYGSPTTTSI